MNNNLPETAPRFHQHQAEFTAFIRDPQNNPPPQDVKLERVSAYAELMFNNIENFLSANFPVLKRIHNPHDWLQLVRDFYRQHHSTSPYFAEIPEEFITYLQTERHNPQDHPFLVELAHYEWVEMALAIAHEEPSPLTPEQIAALPQEKIQLSPLAWPLAYRHPVHQLAPDYLPQEAPAEPTLICVYRDANDEVKFMQITSMTYRLLEQLQNDTPNTAQRYLEQLAQETQHPNPALIIKAGLEILKDLAHKGVIIQA